MKSKKFLSLVMAGVMTLALAVPTFAADEVKTINTDNGSDTTTLTIEAAATTFNVTVPTILAIDVTADSTATVGEGSIINNSTGVVEVKSITLTDGAYTLETYSDKSTFGTYDVGSKKLGLSIAFGGGTNELTGSAKTYKTGSDFTTGSAKELEAGTLKIAAQNTTNQASTLKIASEALVSPTGATATTEAVNAATMTIVVGWYTGTTATGE